MGNSDLHDERVIGITWIGVTCTSSTCSRYTNTKVCGVLKKVLSVLDRESCLGFTYLHYCHIKHMNSGIVRRRTRVITIAGWNKILYVTRTKVQPAKVQRPLYRFISTISYCRSSKLYYTRIVTSR